MEQNQWQSLQITLSQRIKRLRKERGYSQAAFADFTGITQAYLSRVERGKANPPLSIIYKITLACEITLSDLFDFDVLTRPVLNEQEKITKLNTALANLPPCVSAKLYDALAHEILRK